MIIAGYINALVVMCVNERSVIKCKRKLLTNGNAFKRTDDRWGGVVWYMDEHGEKKTKVLLRHNQTGSKEKMTSYIADFEKEIIESMNQKDSARKYAELVTCIQISFSRTNNL